MFLRKSISGYHDLSKEVVIEPTVGVNEAKICLKLVKKPIHSIFIIPKLLHLSTYIPWCFPTSRAYLMTNLISGKNNVVTELKTRISEIKANPKYAKK